MSHEQVGSNAFDFQDSTNFPQNQVNNVSDDAETTAPVNGEAESGCPGLSTCHISPLVWQTQSLPVWDYVKGYGDFLSYYRDCLIPVSVASQYTVTPAKVMFTTDGQLCSVKTERVKILDSGNSSSKDNLLLLEMDGVKVLKTGDSSRVAKRSIVTKFSKKSRKRLMNTLAKTDKQNKPVFVTLTYPDEFPEGDYKAWKRHLDSLGKRLKRLQNSVSFVWRLELKQRLTGKNRGKIAPHYHLLVWNISYQELRGFLPLAWFEIVGSGDDKHLSAGTSVEYLRSHKGVMSYASKYVGKVCDEDGGDIQTGRHWGIVGRAFLPLSDVIVTYLTKTQAIALTRIGRKMIGIKGKQLRYGLTWMIDGTNIEAYLLWLLREGELEPESNITPKFT